MNSTHKVAGSSPAEGAIDMNKTKVSDHALIRWLERVHGVDMEYFRNQILLIVDEAAQAGALSITIDGFCYLIDPDRRSVITIVDGGPGNKNKRDITKSRFRNQRA